MFVLVPIPVLILVPIRIAMFAFDLFKLRLLFRREDSADLGIAGADGLPDSAFAILMDCRHFFGAALRDFLDFLCLLRRKIQSRENFFAEAGRNLLRLRGAKELFLSGFRR